MGQISHLDYSGIIKVIESSHWDFHEFTLQVQCVGIIKNDQMNEVSNGGVKPSPQTFMHRLLSEPSSPCQNGEIYVLRYAAISFEPEPKHLTAHCRVSASVTVEWARGLSGGGHGSWGHTTADLYEYAHLHSFWDWSHSPRPSWFFAPAFSSSYCV